jgi:hypothetical protein
MFQAETLNQKAWRFSMRGMTWVFAAYLACSAGAGLATDGSSGCGPAWYVLKENSLLSSFGRVVTNGVLFPVVTLGMTFGTSNCSKHSIADNDQRSLEFAAQNLDILRQDIARGEGEHLSSYFATFGCRASAYDNLSAALRMRYSQGLYQSDEPYDYVIETRGIINDSGNLREACS